MKIDIDNIKDIKNTPYKTEIITDMTSGIETVPEPISTVSQVSKELGKNLSKDFENNPTSEEIFGGNNSVVTYPLLLLKNVMCPEILESIVEEIDHVTHDLSCEGKFINLYYSLSDGKVRFIGYKKVNMVLFKLFRSYLIELVYYESKHTIKEIQYEDFMDFDKFKPLIVFDDKNMKHFKSRFKQDELTADLIESSDDIVELQMKLIQEIQDRSNSKIKQDAPPQTIVNQFFPKEDTSAEEINLPDKDNVTDIHSKQEEDLIESEIDKLDAISFI